MKSNQESNLNDLINACEKLCDDLRSMRRSKPNDFFGSPEEELLKNLDKTLNVFYRDGVTEPRENMRLKREVERLGTRINELEYELSQHEKKN